MPSDKWTNYRPTDCVLKLFGSSGSKPLVEVDTTNLLAFHGKESLCGSYFFQIHFRIEVKDDKTKFTDIQGQKGVLSITAAKTADGDAKVTRYFAGVVTELESMNRGVQEFNEIYNHYRVKLVPPTDYLRNSDIFSGIFPCTGTRVDLLASLYEKACGTKPAQNITQASSFDKPKYCIRYQESFKGFLHRVLEQEGVCWYYTYAEDGTAKLNITDAADGPSSGGSSTPEMIIYDPPPISGYFNTMGNYYHIDNLDPFLNNRYTRNVAISLIQREGSYPSKCKVSQYDPGTGALASGESASSGGGGGASTGGSAEGINAADEASYFAVSFAADASGKRIANAKKTHFEAIAAVVVIETFDPFIKLYEKFTIETLKSVSLNLENKGSYKPIAIEHWFTVKRGYSNVVEAIPSTKIFAPARVQPIPNMSGHFIGQVTQAKDTVTANQISTPDSSGGSSGGSTIPCQAYSTLYFDGCKTKTPIEVRVAAMHASKKWGYFGIPREGTEVLIEFTDGHPDGVPVVVSQAYNKQNMPAFDWSTDKNITGFQSSQVGADASAQGTTPATDDSKWPTYNAYYFNDDTTATSQQYVQLAGGDMIGKITGKTTVTGKDEMTYTSLKKITIQYKASASGDAVTSIVMDENGMTLKFKETTVKLDANGFTVDSSAKCAMTSKTATNINAGTDFAAKGTASGTLNGGPSTEVKGTMVTVQGSGPTTVKGAIVNINS